MLLQTGGLAEAKGGRLALTPAGRAALGSPPHRTLRSIWNLWMAADVRSAELARLDFVKGQTGKGQAFLTHPRERRRAVVTSLAACPPGKWASADTLLRFATAVGGRTEVTLIPSTLHLGSPQYGHFGTDGGAEALALRCFLCVLLESAATLGLIDVALTPPAGARPLPTGYWGQADLPYLSRYDGLVAASLTPLGAYILGCSATYAPPSVANRHTLRLGDEGEVTIRGDDRPFELVAMLDAHAGPIDGGAWRPTAASLIAAAQKGRATAAFRGFLELQGGPLPLALAALLDDVERRHGPDLPLRGRASGGRPLDRSGGAQTVRHRR